MPAKHNIHTRYRADIDGLRALAILPVVAFHAFPEWIPGGFVGVDIFFVISGFLISTILFQSLANNSFNLTEFYIHRIKRIFPALLLVMIASYSFGWFVLFPDEFKQLGKHLAAGAGFIQNWVLWQEVGYFDTASDLKPMLHLWSLAIEEQFYLIFPIFLWVAWRLGFNLFYCVLFIALGSFLDNCYWMRKDIVHAFFAPESRFWELMTGTMLAWIRLNGQAVNPFGKLLFFWHGTENKRQSAWLRSALSVFGLGCIVCAIFMYSKTIPYPGRRALLPVMGAISLIAAGQEAWINRILLSNRIAVWVGLISYPLYLWHWPLLSFARIAQNGTPDCTVRFGLVMAAFGFAALTYYWVEKPIRFGSRTRLVPVKESSPHWTKKPERRWIVPVILCGLMIGVGTVGLYSYREDGFKQRPIAQRNQKIIAAIGEWEHPRGLIKRTIAGVNVYATSQEDPEVLFLGDSHCEQLSPRVVELAKRKPIHAVFLAQGGCAAIPDLYTDAGSYSFRSEKDLFTLATQPTLKTVVICGFWHGYLYELKKLGYYVKDKDGRKVLGTEGRTLALASMKAFLTKISKYYSSVYLVLDQPRAPEVDPKRMINRFSATDLTATYKVDPSQIELHREMTRVASEAGVKIIDPFPIFVEAGLGKRLDENGEPIYKDDNHLRPSWVRTHATYIDQVFDDLPKQPVAQPK